MMIVHSLKARNECNETVPSVLAPAYYDVAEAATDCSEVEDGVFEVDEHPHPEHLQGIKWIYESPCLQSIAHIQFSPCTIMPWQTKFVSKYKTPFTVILFITSEGEFSGATSTGETYVPPHPRPLICFGHTYVPLVEGFNRTAVIYRICI